MLIQKEMNLADVIHHDHNLIPVINRFNISLGFGDKRIEELCIEKQINPEFFLTIINAYHDHKYFPKKHLQSFPASLLVSYLKKSHTYYLENKIPEIEELITKLIQKGPAENKTYSLIQNFFLEYKKELQQHIYREEERVYPYVLKLENAIANDEIPEILLEEMNNYSINDYEDEHDDVEEKLYDLKNIIIKYMPPSANDDLFFNILKDLFELENDLNDHSRIEDLILVPKVEAMEFTIKSMHK